MTAWRESASQQAQDDLDGILGPALDFAKQQLTDHGEFYPYAVAVETSGDTQMIAADLPKDRPASAEVIIDLINTLSRRRDEFRAVAIVADTTAPRPNDGAIRVTLEHRDGVALNVFLPYARRRAGRALSWGNLEAAGVGSHIW